MDEVVRQLDDLHRIAHIQHERLAAPRRPQGRRLQHELLRLRDSHEMAGHLEVGHRHRPARRDLPLEQRHHRPAAPQHVAEAYRYVDRARALRRRARHQWRG